MEGECVSALHSAEARRLPGEWNVPALSSLTNLAQASPNRTPPGIRVFGLTVYKSFSPAGFDSDRAFKATEAQTAAPGHSGIMGPTVNYLSGGFCSERTITRDALKKGSLRLRQAPQSKCSAEL